jgi:hypothetical protein
MTWWLANWLTGWFWELEGSKPLCR